MALSAGALTTVAVVADELSVDAGDADTLARLERYIDACSSLIAVTLGNGRARQLHEAAVVSVVAGMDHPTLVLPHTPIVSITSIEVDGEPLDVDAYEIEDAEAGFVRCLSGVWRAQLIARGFVVGRGVPGTERRYITAGYIAGWRTRPQGGTITLPPAIEDACVQLVASRWRARGADARVAQEAGSNTSRTFYGDPLLPPSIMAALAPFVRVAMA
jgi:hypothetical protein